jgi:hypothetical protein
MRLGGKQRCQKSDAPCDESLRGWQVSHEWENHTMSVVSAARQAICVVHLLQIDTEIVWLAVHYGDQT